MTVLYAICIETNRIAGESVYDWWDFKGEFWGKPDKKCCSYLTHDGELAKTVLARYAHAKGILRIYNLIKEQNDGA